MDASTNINNPNNAIQENEYEYEFPRGAIISIQVLRFMVYDEATFYMHPKLNMIIGPNGTGKSTIVCAIVIGFGASPKLTGRGNDLFDYVQNGQSKAVTKIKLSMGKDEPPIFIRRILNKTRHSSDFYINKTKSTLAQVEALMKQLHIQIDNICQFLPQEKVSSLAAMDNIQLLHEVQVAAGSEEMVQQHESLKELDYEILGMEHNLSHLDERIRTNTAKNESIHAQYQTLQHRLDLMKSLSLTTILLCALKYDKFKDQLKEYSAERKRLTKQLATAQKASAPMENSFKNERLTIREMKSQVKSHSDRLDRWVRKSHDFHLRFTRSQESQETLRQDLERWKKKKADVRAFINDLKRDKATLLLECEKPDPVDPKALQELEAQHKASLQKANVLYFEQRGLEDKKKTLTEKMKELQRQKDELQSKLNQLQNRSSQTLASLKNYEPARLGLEAHDWVQSHRHLFKGEVRGPMVLHIHVMHESVGHYVEAAIGRPALLNTFLVENEEDYERLCAHFIENPNRAERRNLSFYLHKLQSLRPALSTDLVRRLGFDGVLSDAIVADEYTKNWLLHTTSLQSIPYTLKHVNYDKADEEVSIERYLAGHTMIINRRSEMYPSQTLSITRKLEPSRSVFRISFLKHTQECQACEQDLQKCRADFDALLEEIKVVAQKMEPIAQERQKWEREKHVALEKIKALNLLREEHVLNTKKLQELEAEIIEKEKILEDTNAKIQQVGVQSEKCIKEKLELLEPWAELLRQIPSLYKEKRIRILQVAIAEHELRNSMQQHIDSLEEVNRLEQELKSVTESIEDIREKATEIRSAYHSAISELNVEEKEALIEQERTNLNLASKPEEERLHFLDRRQVDLRAQLSAMPSTDLDIIHVFEERAQAIRRFQEEKLACIQSKQEKQEQRETLARDWETRLNELIQVVSEHFSNYFNQIGCAGEVIAHKPSKFKDYALQIRVKFRAAQEFQVLDKARQSGGERAVSTILFLLSLQRFSKAPFRLVDEINQGMDTRNERLVHRLLVQAASRPDAPQYFLITPKLLSDLYYSEHMKIHCIMNGAGVHSSLVDPERTFFTTREYLQRKKEVQTPA